MMKLGLCGFWFLACVGWGMGQDAGPAGITIVSPDISQVSPAFVEGTCGAEFTEILVIVDDRKPISAVRRSPTTWYADVKLATGGAVAITATAAMFGGEPVRVQQALSWLVTDVARGEPLLVRKNDIVRFTAKGPGRELEIDPGIGEWRKAGAPGALFNWSFPAAGAFTVKARIDGGPVMQMLVSVVEVAFNGPVACEVGYTRDLEITVVPPAAAGGVAVEAADPDLLAVYADHPTPQGQLLKVSPLMRGRPMMEARLGGANGPIVAVQEVDEFTIVLQVDEMKGALQCFGDDNIGRSHIWISPHLPGIKVRFKNHQPGCSFMNDKQELTIDTGTDFRPDPYRVDSAGYYYGVKMPPDSDRYWFSVFFTQNGVQVASEK
jgi:hypothetical protein